MQRRLPGTERNMLDAEVLSDLASIGQEPVSGSWPGRHETPLPCVLRQSGGRFDRRGGSADPLANDRRSRHRGKSLQADRAGSRRRRPIGMSRPSNSCHRWVASSGSQPSGDECVGPFRRVARPGIALRGRRCTSPLSGLMGVPAPPACGVMDAPPPAPEPAGPLAALPSAVGCACTETLAMPPIVSNTAVTIAEFMMILRIRPGRAAYRS
jgi:hypothetical protein